LEGDLYNRPTLNHDYFKMQSVSVRINQMTEIDCKLNSSTGS